MTKDYFAEKEAAEYCCVGLTKFRELVNQYAITVGRFGTKKLYRKSDLQRIIEKEAFSNGQCISAKR